MTIGGLTRGYAARSALVAAVVLLAVGTPAARADAAAPADPATLAVESEPKGAVVYIDGQLVGATPLAVEGIAVGDHAVRLVKAGFLENSRRISVPASGAVLRVELTPTGTPSARPQPRVEPDSTKSGAGRKSRKWRLVGAGAAAVGASFLGYKVLSRNEAPTVSGVVADPSTALQGATSVSFSASVTDKDGDALSYAWDFGDGGTGTGASPSYAYQSPGEYVVTVEVSDGKKTGKGSVNVTVKSMAGRWTGRLDATSPITFNLGQDRSLVAGSYQAVYPGSRSVAGTVTGSVSSQNRVTLTVRVPNYWPLSCEASLDQGMDSMSGTATENGVPYPFQLTRQ